MCSVFLPKEDRVISIAAEHLQPVEPRRGERVKVIMGERFLNVVPLELWSLQIDQLHLAISIENGNKNGLNN